MRAVALEPLRLPVRLGYNPATGPRDGRAGGGVEMPMERQYRGWVLTLATFMWWMGAVGQALAEPAGDETFEGSFSCVEPTGKGDISPILCQTSINPGLPVLDLSLVWHADPKSGERVLDSIEIRRSGEAESFQVLTGIASHLPADTGKAGVEMLDLNFDGFLDMRIRRSADGAEGSYQNWLWSKESGAFVANPGLDAIAAPKFDADDQEIVSRWRKTPAEQGVDIYSYDGATPILVHRETDRTGADGVCRRSFYDRIDDELKETGTGACADE